MKMLQTSRRRVNREDVFMGFIIASPAIFAALLAFTVVVELGRIANDPLIYVVVAVGVIVIFTPTTYSWYNRIDGRLGLDPGEREFRVVLMGLKMAAVNQMVWNHTELLNMGGRIVLSAVVIVIMVGAFATIFPSKREGWRGTSRFSVIGWFVAIVLLSLTYVVAVLDATWTVEWWQVILRVFLLLLMPVAAVFAIVFAMAVQPDEVVMRHAFP